MDRDAGRAAKRLAATADRLAMIARIPPDRLLEHGEAAAAMKNSAKTWTKARADRAEAAMFKHVESVVRARVWARPHGSPVDIHRFVVDQTDHLVREFGVPGVPAALPLDLAARVLRSALRSHPAGRERSFDREVLDHCRDAVLACFARHASESAKHELTKLYKPGEGGVGFANAIEKWDPDKGPFSSYVRACIGNDASWAGQARSRRPLLRELERWLLVLRQQLGREPTREDVQKATGWPASRVEKAFMAAAGRNRSAEEIAAPVCETSDLFGASDLDRAISTLDSRSRAVLLLSDFHGDSYKDIERKLQLTVGNAKVIKCRARKHLASWVGLMRSPAIGQQRQFLLSVARLPIPVCNDPKYANAIRPVVSYVVEETRRAHFSIDKRSAAVLRGIFVDGLPPTPEGLEPASGAAGLNPPLNAHDIHDAWTRFCRIVNKVLNLPSGYLESWAQLICHPSLSDGRSLLHQTHVMYRPLAKADGDDYAARMLDFVSFVTDLERRRHFGLGNAESDVLRAMFRPAPAVDPTASLVLSRRGVAPPVNPNAPLVLTAAELVHVLPEAPKAADLARAFAAVRYILRVVVDPAVNELRERTNRTAN